MADKAASTSLADYLRRLRGMAGTAGFVSYLAGSLAWHGAPRPVGIEARLASLRCEGLPLEDEVRIRWSDQQVPFLEAGHDEDLALALGVVHAHLRLAQIDFMRRVALGRLSEVVGPMAVASDEALRTIDFQRAGAQVAKALPDPSRRWLERFVEGINWHIDNLETLPHEFEVLGIKPARWSLGDALAVSRLASLDFTWKVWMRLLRLRHRTDWDDLWERLMTEPTMQPPSVAGQGGVETLLGAHGRSGSNAYAIAPARAANGGALIANDPHLSITMPNSWLVVGLRSPSYHAVGMMVPGVPVMGLGRNPWIAWGGTSLHGASSELVDVSRQPASAIGTRRERIGVRWGRDRTLTVRESAFGPIVSDVRLLRMARNKPVALHWMGHRPSDEVTPFLSLAKARSWDDFLQAFDGYAIPGLNMIYADGQGRIGQAIAATLPRRPRVAPSDIVSEPEALDHWNSFVCTRDLPHSVDPPEAFVASANNAPPPTDVSLSLFFSPDDRVQRLRNVLSQARSLTTSDLARLQKDVISDPARALKDRLLVHLPADPSAPQAALVTALRDWDGAYHADSAGALAFELVTFHLVSRLHGRLGARLYTASWDMFSLLNRDLDEAPPEQIETALAGAVSAAARTFGRLGTWGAAHRLRLAHVFALLPGLGRRYVYDDFGVGGSNETLMKTAYGFTGSRHRVRFGANARHVSDLADPDANYFTLLGGQDGWLGSSTFMDQVEDWKQGRLFQVPLTPERVKAAFPYVTVLRPPPAGKHG